MKRVAILGSTGSVGTQALDVISRQPDEFAVEALAAGSNAELLLQQIAAFRPRVVSVGSQELAERIRPHLPGGVRLVWGEAGLIEAAAGTEADFVLTAIVGSLGLKPTLAAIEAGKTIGLANKETLVAGGAIVCEAATRHGVRLLPVDSEHSAIFQCLNGESANRIGKLIVTASGGSFRDRERSELADVTVEQALKHPNWSMGAKVTIDSATMANKGLEVIEAHWLFGLDYDRIEVLIHPESIIHSMVEYVDGSVIAQLGTPDMRVPIQYALTYPDRLPNPAPKLDLAQIGKLHFRPADFARYPALKLAYESGRAGGAATAVYNAANEVAVARFVRGELPFLAIDDVIADALEAHKPVASPDLEAVLEADAQARRRAEAFAWTR